jgi:signal transduction histidine kinase
VPARLAFRLLPYWWQRGLYQGIGAAAGAVLLATFVWAAARRRNAARLERLERSHALERERARIARDIHDDLGSGLTRIMLLSESARSELPPGSAASGDVESIRRAADDLTRAMDEIVWAVDPRHDSLDSLVGYVGSAAQEFLKAANLRFRLEAPDQLPSWPLTAECRYSLFLAFREALNNVIRHARARTVRVVFAVEENAFTLTIEDDGKGFDPATAVSRPGGGRGLNHMKDRLTERGGSCQITSSPGQGTRVVFRLSRRSIPVS